MEFIEILKDEEKNISDIIGDYFDKIISNNQYNENNNFKKNKKYNYSYYAGDKICFNNNNRN